MSQGCAAIVSAGYQQDVGGYLRDDSGNARIDKRPAEHETQVKTSDSKPFRVGPLPLDISVDHVPPMLPVVGCYVMSAPRMLINAPKFEGAMSDQAKATRTRQFMAGKSLVHMSQGPTGGSRGMSTISSRAVGNCSMAKKTQRLQWSGSMLLM